MADIFFLLGFLFFVIAVWPFGPYPLTLMIAKRLGSFPTLNPQGDGRELTFSICLCAYNEEAVIRDKIENMLEMARAAGEDRVEILLYLDHPSDRTAVIAHEYADRITIIHRTARAGKPIGMNWLVTTAKNDIVVFTEANVRVDSQALVNLRKYFDDPSVD
mgnify:CR=1 FL=1